MAGGGLTRQVAAKKMMQLEQKEKGMESKEKQYLAKLTQSTKPALPSAPKRQIKRISR